MTELALTVALAIVAATTPKTATKIPSITAACWSVTNYWPYDRSGKLRPFNGQADADPYHTAVMHPVTIDQAGGFVAGPAPLLGATAVFPDGSHLPILDTFGRKAYRRGVFWHQSYEAWVIGIDVFSPKPLHYLECDGRINS